MLSFSEVYNMPLYLRKFYFKRLQKHYKEQNEEMEKAQKGNTNYKSSNMYFERCEQLKKKNPKDWTGVWVATSK